MATTFRRLLAPPESLCAGDFTVQTESGRAVLCCCLCGERFELPVGCGVDQVGRTSVAVQCPRPACSFWDWCVLTDHYEEILT